MKKITKTLLENLNTIKKLKEAPSMESIVDEASRYLFDEGDSDYLPDWEEFKDYTMDIPRNLFDKAKENALKALTTLSEHNYTGDNKTYLELSDNHTMWELDNESKEIDTWFNIVEKKLEEFEKETGVEVWQAGRSGRHIVVEPTYDNCINFDYLQETQERLEQEAIKEFNGEEIKESVSNNYYLPYYAGDKNDCEEEAERLKDMGFTKEYNVKIIVRKAINADTGKEDSTLYSVDFIGSKPALLNVARNFPILSEFGNEAEFDSIIYREDSRLQESTESIIDEHEAPEELETLVRTKIKENGGNLPDEIEYKGKIYKCFNVMSHETSGDKSLVYYCNMDKTPSGDPQESDDYFFVNTTLKLNPNGNGFKGVREVNYVEDLTESEGQLYIYSNAESESYIKPYNEV